MKGDFSRVTFDSRKNYSRVLSQQGRVQLDADSNEQVAIFWHYLRTLAADLIGPHAGPQWNVGFEILLGENSFTIGEGRYYVDGILCESWAKEVADGKKVLFQYGDQPDYPLDKDEALPEGSYWVYLEVWERHITYLHDDNIREVALNGPDTATRAQVVWQVKTVKSGHQTLAELPGQEDDEGNAPKDREKLLRAWRDQSTSLLPGSNGQMKARAKIEKEPTDPCIIDPQARYRGPENQLYRVEIHKGNVTGSGQSGNENADDDEVTFKWSRDNGSVVFPIVSMKIGDDGQATVAVEHLGRDDRLTLKEGDWVEIVVDHYVLHGEAGPLVQVDSIDRDQFTVTLSLPEGADMEILDSGAHRLLRRWDQTASQSLDLLEGAVPLNEKMTDYIELEDGVQVSFHPQARYRTGDYWLIPARTATGDVEWPRQGDKPLWLPPRGVEHHYAPLAWVGAGDEDAVHDLRCAFQAECLIPAKGLTAVLAGSDRIVSPGRSSTLDARIADLQRIDNIGKRRAEDLVKAGITEVAMVAAMDVPRLVEVIGVSEELAEEIIADAKRRVASNG
ncbi:MAG TPA: DUF6519 domain-containing protein [Acidobacteriota bacterium]|nr:DUF6519 domain-containing protein [Acidobacteriota bacterium]